MPNSSHQKRYRPNSQKCSPKCLIVIAARYADLMAKSPVYCR